MAANTFVVPLRFPVSIWEGGFADPTSFSRQSQAEIAVFATESDRVFKSLRLGWSLLLVQGLKGVIIAHVIHKAFSPL